MENIKSLKEAFKEMAIELKHNKVSVDHIILYLLKNTDFDDLVSKVYKVDAKHLEKELEESLTEEYQGETGDITETYLCREFWEECSDVSTRAEIYYHILTNDKTIFSEILENESDIYGKISVKMMNGGLMFTKRAENNPMSEAEDEFLSEFGDFLSELARAPEHSGKKSRKKEIYTSSIMTKQISCGILGDKSRKKSAERRRL